MKPSPPATACFLRLRTGAARSVAKGRTVAGQPVRRFLKELIKAGHYVKESDGLEFNVTPALLEHWAATFARMRANGLNVPVPSGHTHDGAANRGWVRHLFRAGDSLYGVVDLVGDGIPMAATNDVSIYAVPEFTDGHGNRYQWPILHVALCTDPVVPGLGGFLPIAAALDSPPADAPVFRMRTVAGPRIPGSAGVAAGANQHDFPRKTLAGAPMSIADASGQVSAADQISEAFSQAVLQVLQDDDLDLKGKLTRIKEILTGQEKALAIFAEDESPSSASTQGFPPAGAARGGGARGHGRDEPGGCGAAGPDRGPQPASRPGRPGPRRSPDPGGGRRLGAAFCSQRGEGPATEHRPGRASAVRRRGGRVAEEPGDRDGRADRPAGDGPGPALDGRRSVRRRDAGADEDRRGTEIQRRPAATSDASGPTRPGSDWSPRTTNHRPLTTGHWPLTTGH